MLRNFFIVAIRNMARAKGFAFINIAGLAIGMAATVLIMLYVTDELSYDKYHEKSDRIYRLSRAWVNQDGETNLHLGNVAPPFAPLLESDFEGTILNAVRFLNDNPLITYEDTKIEEDRVFFSEQDVFEVFSWEMIAGDPQTALKEPASIVMTESTARKYFGEEDPIGKQVNYNNLMEMKVTGVTKDVPLNSHFQWDMLVSFQTVEDFFGLENLMQNWGSNNYTTYLLLPENYDYKEMQAQFPDFLDRHQTHGERKPSEGNYLTLWPLTSIHLHSHLDSEVEPNGNIVYIYVYSIIALFILAIACINFMNLSTARSAKRAREVGLRKVMGAYRISLIRQFIIESIFFAVLGMILAVIIVVLSLPAFNVFIGKELSLSMNGNGQVGFYLLVITLIVGIVAGSYPAFYLSSFRPAVILKGERKSSKKKFTFRSLLVIIQFMISITLIIGVGIVQNQISYMQSKELGFNESNMLILPVNDEIYGNYESLKQQFEAQPGIESVSLSSIIPSGRLLDSQGTMAEVDGEMKNINFRVADVHIDHGFLDNLGVKFASGRNFDQERASDSTEAFIINHSAAEAIGWESDDAAVGKKFNYGGRSGLIIGIVEDFHFESLHQEIAPIVFLITAGRSRSMAIRIVEDRRDETLGYLQEQWTYLRPGFPFDFFEIDQRFDAQYQNEERLSTAITIFSMLAIAIASLGLFGLSSFIAELRIKEIGIRKVMGATIPQLLYLLTSGFTVLVLISFLIAAPLAYWVMTKWLGNFAYTDQIHVTPFIVSIGLALLIAWATVSYQTIKAAMTNPVNSLRYE
jgi:putative ABC transport system permease protein